MVKNILKRAQLIGWLFIGLCLSASFAYGQIINVSQVANPIATSPLLAESTAQVILNFSLTRQGGTATAFTALSITTSTDPNLVFSNAVLYAIGPSGTTVGNATVALNNSSIVFTQLNNTPLWNFAQGGQNSGPINFRIIVDVKPTVPTTVANNPQIQLTLTQAGITMSNGTVSAFSFASSNYNFKGCTTPSLSTGATNNSNCVGPNGAAIVTASTAGGEPAAGYSYQWYQGTDTSNPIGGAISNTLSNQASGSYTVKVLNNDFSSCSSLATVTINDDLSLPIIDEAAVTIIKETSPGASDGSIETGSSVTGGSGSYTYKWYTIQLDPIGTNSSLISNLTAGEYILEVVDETTGCSSDQQIFSVLVQPTVTNEITCNASFIDTGGSSAGYLDNEDIIKTFVPEIIDHKIKISFSEFFIEEGYDYMYIYDGPDINAPLLGTYTGGDQPPDIISAAPDGELTLRFTSDASVTESGWQASVTCVPAGTPIVRTFNPTGAPVGTEVVILGANFSIVPTENLVQFGTIAATVIEASTTQLTVLVPVGATTNAISVTVNGITVSSNLPFSVGPLHVAMTDGIIQACDINFMDPGGVNDYTINQDITQTISPLIPGDVIKVSFTSFSLEEGYDFLYVYDGPTTASPLIATLTGSVIPTDIMATGAGGELTFRFSSDYAANGSGWQAAITCGKYCSPPSLPVINVAGVTITNETSRGASDGSINASGAVTGGSGSYTYKWYNSQLNPIGTNSTLINNLTAGDYLLEVADGITGCSSEQKTFGVLIQQSITTVKVNDLIGYELTNLHQIFDPFNPVYSNEEFIINDDRVLIEIIFLEVKQNELLAIITSYGFEFDPSITDNVNDRIITGWFPIENLLLLNNYPEIINYVRPAYPPVMSIGVVTTQGDKAIGSDLTRLGFNIEGAGVKVGVLSDSFNSQNDVANWDLPGDPNHPFGLFNPVQVIKELPSIYGIGKDEGRAMLQIIHDVSPKAELAFRTGVISEVDLANGIIELQQTGCNVIVDDISFVTEPFFLDGIVTQSVEYVAAQGISYFTAAGNFGSNSYEAVFNGTNAPIGISGEAHNFAGGDVYQSITLQPGTYTIVLQWEDPWYSLGQVGASHDLDIYLSNVNGQTFFGSNRNNLGGDPIEVLSFSTQDYNPTTELIIARAAGMGPVKFKYVVFRGQISINEYKTPASTIVGHANASGAMTVGAILYTNTPAFNFQNPFPIEPFTVAGFSSRGGTIVNGINRMKPDFIAPNGVNTTVNLGAPDFDNDGFPNFFGTSAAAAHAAGAAALLIEARRNYYYEELSPQEVRRLLQSNSWDMHELGFDFLSGAGFLQLLPAITSFANSIPMVTQLVVPDGIIPGEEPFTTTIIGEFFTPESEVLLRDVNLEVTFISSNELQANIPVFRGNPTIEVVNAPRSPSFLDGGSAVIQFFSTVKKEILITVDDKVKRFGTELPNLTSTITVDGVILEDQEVLNILQNSIQYFTFASSMSNAGKYLISAQLNQELIEIWLIELYNIQAMSGVLTIPLPFDDYPVTRTDFGNALDFDGVNDFILIPPDTLNSINNGFTIEVWAKYGGGNEDLFSISTSDGGSIKLTLSGFYREPGNYHIDNERFPIIDNEWHHLAVTVNNDVGILYVDGLLSGHFDNFPANLEASLSKIGASITNDSFFEGALDELRIWNYPRSALELNQRLYIPTTGKEPGLVYYFDFNQGMPNGNNFGITYLNDAVKGKEGELLGFGLAGSDSNWVPSQLNEGNTDVPVFTAISPTSSIPGKEVILYGLSVIDDPLIYKVTFGSEEAQISGYGNKTLKVIVPDGITGLNKVRVTNTYGTSKPLDFTIVSPLSELPFSWKKQTIYSQITPSVIEHGDVNGDGFQDIVVAGTRELTYLQNNGSGNFPTRSLVASSLNTTYTDIFLSDLDADGDIDIVATENSTLLVWFQNNGFGSSWTRAVVAPPSGFIENKFMQLKSFNGTPDFTNITQTIDYFEYVGDINFTIRWSGVITPDHTDTYTFYARSNDGVRLWVDDNLVIDKWINQVNQPTEEDFNGWEGNINLNAGIPYAIKFEYFYENSNEKADSIAMASLRWSSSTLSEELVPYQITPTTLIGGIESIDADRDGDNDIIVYYELGGIRILTNDGNGGFSYSNFNITDEIGNKLLNNGNYNRPKSLIVGDYNKDDFFDISVVAPDDNGKDNLFTFISKGLFAGYQRENIGPNSSYGDVISAVDLNNDGFEDIADIGFECCFGYQLNQGGSFQTSARVAGPITTKGSFLESADLNGDGYVDFLTAYNSTVVDANWLKNERGTGFTTNSISFANGAHDALNVVDGRAVDLDNDGDLDVVTASTQDNRVIAFFHVFSDKDFKTFQLTEQAAGTTATIDAQAHTVDITVNNTANLTKLIPDFTLSLKASASVGATSQISNETLADFNNTSKSLVYTITAEDGSKQNWTVRVHPLPGVPVLNTITAIIPTGAKVNLTNGSFTDANEFEVSSDNFATIINGTSATLTGLSAGTNYQVRAKGKNTYGLSEEYSNVLSFITIPSTPVLNAVANITQTSAIASWPSVTGADSYKVEVSAGGVAFSPYNPIEVTSSNLSITGLTGGVEYKVKVSAVNASGGSAYSTQVAFVTIPANPIAAAATVVAANSFVSNWNNVPGAASYAVDLSTDNFASVLQTKDAIGTSVVFDNLTSGNTYSYQVRAVNSSGLASGNSNLISLSILPAAPSLDATTAITLTSATLNWQPVNGATNYQLDLSKDNFSTYVQPYNNFIVGTRTFQLNDLSPGTTYQFRVRSSNASGTSTNFSASGFITVPSIPVTKAPSSITTTSFTANWDAVINPSVSGYEVELSADNFTSVLKSENITAGTTVQFTGLTPGTGYVYRARAKNANNLSSGNSSSISLVTLPVKPEVQSITGISQKGATLSWQPVQGATVYQIDVSKDNFSTLVVNGQQSGATTLVLSDLTAGTDYSIRIRAANAGGASANSETRVFTTVPPEPIAKEATLKTSVSFVANWDASPTATSYSVELSDNNFSTILKTTTTSETFSSFTDLTLGKTYSYKVNATNVSGTSGYSNAIQMVPAYSVTITNQFFDENTKTASITAISSAGIDSVRLFYRGIASGEYKSVNVPLTSGTTYEITITTEMQDEMGTEYYFKVKDKLSDQRRGDLSYYYKRIETAERVQIPITRFGRGASNYTLFSVPYQLDDQDMENVFEPVLGSYDDTRWKLVRYQDGRNVDYGSGLNKLEPGKGYWFASLNQVQPQVGSGTVVRANRALVYSLFLQKGWNQVGDPLPFDVSWTDVLDNNKEVKGVGRLYVFEGGAFKRGDLKMWGGGFVKSERDVELKIPVTVKRSSSGRNSDTDITNTDISQSAWITPLTIEQGGAINDLGAIGMHERASVTSDEFDEQSLPRFINYLELNSYHPEYFIPRFMRDIVTTAPSFNWSYVVESDYEDEQATLRWDADAMGQNEAQLILFDQEGLQLIDMKQRSSYAFKFTGKRSLKFFYAKDKEHLKPDIDGSGLPFPNPFTQRTSIPFVISKASTNVSCTVYDLLGRQVKTLLLEPSESGYHEIEWDGTDTQGLRVASGIYMYRISFGTKQTQTGRVILN